MKCEFSRREFLVATVAAGAVIASGCSTCARNSRANTKAIVSVIATKNPDDTLRVPGGGKLQPGAVLAFTFPPDDEIHGVIFLTREAQLRALSTRCTHAGCTVAWQRKGDTESLKCPCHGSRFDIAGQVLNGPAKLPLARYAVRVEGNDAIVTLPS